MILGIETSTRVCTVALHSEGELIASQSYHLDKSHSSLLPGILDQLLKNSGVEKSDLKAVSVSEGPGSYTGLRIGVSAAKGLAFGLDIPLISIPTLYLIAGSLQGSMAPDTLAIPMIDARRMEVYASVYDHQMNCIRAVEPMIIDENSFSKYADYRLLLLGDGASKCEIIGHRSYQILDEIFPDARCMGKLAYQKFLDKSFEDVAYFEPLYLKQFQTKKAKNRLLD